MKKFFIILAVVILVVIIGGGIYIYVNKDNLASMALNQAFKGVEQATLQNLPEGYDAQEIKDLITAAKTKAAESGFQNPDLQALMMSFKQAYEDKMIDSTEVATLVSDLKKIAE